ncbi:hypothetical protein [Phytoactinopolyspora halotolerans]|uniref:Uncharacterized protein n=1 Tax=Phytoactinopolyspora halotolerans TaxID=1981512 RepID=A0A6L9S798_9ACTN|nr:hypothetical protein [Phytoactinopolyspora halotolerans]NEE00452.1 hypothetical protein [Phytoactinopolyspora halotolerans]
MSSPVTSELEPATAGHVSEYLFERGWSDGLPLVPATEESVQAFLVHTSRDEDEIVARLPQLDREATVRDLAVHAVMAGCRPEYFPVVLAAWDALSAERSALGGGWQSTSGPAPFVIVNGPIRAELGINSTGGVLGPGFRPNATIPRAIGLTVRNSFRVIPHALEQATQGLPGRWTMLIGEDEEHSPWEPLSVDGGLPAGADSVTATLVRTCEFVDNRHFSDPEEVLRDFADTLSRSGSWIFRHSSAAIVLNPDHARVFAEAGMDKQDVREWIVGHASKTEAELAAVGKGLSGQLPDGPFAPDHVHPVFADARPANLPIIVAGSRNAAMSMVVRIFSTWSGRSFPIR